MDGLEQELNKMEQKKMEKQVQQQVQQQMQQQMMMPQQQTQRQQQKKQSSLLPQNIDHEKLFKVMVITICILIIVIVILILVIRFAMKKLRQFKSGKLEFDTQKKIKQNNEKLNEDIFKKQQSLQKQIDRINLKDLSNLEKNEQQQGQGQEQVQESPQQEETMPVGQEFQPQNQMQAIQQQQQLQQQQQPQKPLTRIEQIQQEVYRANALPGQAQMQAQQADVFSMGAQLAENIKQGIQTSQKKVQPYENIQYQ